MEFKLNILPSPEDIRDYIADNIYPVTSIPPSLDLRPELQPIRNQGKQGSCAAQTAACCKEWQERKDIGLSQHMSPQFVYNLRENQNSEGMYGRDVMRILTKYGICKEIDYPYGTTSNNIPTSVLKIAENFRIKSYARVNSINTLKTALLTNGPCYISFPCYNSKPKFWKKNFGDVSLGGHAVTVVGYTQQGFIIRNSWGSDWGTNGYCLYPYQEWGIHWEIWTTIDADSYKLSPKPEPRDSPMINNCLPCCTI